MIATKIAVSAAAVSIGLILAACGQSESGTGDTPPDTRDGGSVKWSAWGIKGERNGGTTLAGADSTATVAHAGEISAYLDFDFERGFNDSRPEVELVAKSNTSDNTFDGQGVWNRHVVLPDDAGDRNQSDDSKFAVVPVEADGTAAFAVSYVVKPKQEGLNITRQAATRIVVYRADNGNEIRRFDASLSNGVAVASTKNTMMIREDAKFATYDVATGNKIWSVADQNSMFLRQQLRQPVTGSPSDFYITTAYDRADVSGYTVFNANTGQIIRSNTTDRVREIAFDSSLVVQRDNTPEYQVVEAASGAIKGKTVTINCISNGPCINEEAEAAPDPRANSAGGVTFDPVNKVLVAATGASHQGKVAGAGVVAWSIETGQPMWSIQSPTLVGADFTYSSRPVGIASLLGATNGNIWIDSSGTGTVAVNSTDGKQVCIKDKIKCPLNEAIDNGGP